MPKVIIDTSNAPDSGNFEPYAGPIPPAGLYKAIWKRGWWTKSSTGKPMLKMLFILESSKESVTQFNGCPTFHNITNESSTAWKMKELFTALGTGPKSAIDFDEKGSVTRIGSARPGKTYLLINSSVELYQGKQRMGVKNLAPLPGTVIEDDIEAEGDATPYDESMLPDAPANEDIWNEADDAWAADPDIGGEPPF